MSSQPRPSSTRLKTLPEIFRESMDLHMSENLYLSIPAEVTSVDNYESQQSVDVKPLIGTVYSDGDVVNPVNLKNIFVKLPDGGGFSVCIPIKVGDLVTLHWTHRSLNSYLAGDGSQSNEGIDANFQRRDCYVLHGFGTRFNNQSPSKTDFIIKGDNSTVNITPLGVVTIDAKEVNVNCETSTVSAGTSVDVNTPLSTFSSDVKINGKLDVVGEVSSTTGMKAPAYGSLTGTGGTMTIGNITAQSSVTINGKSVEGHDHNNSNNVPF